MARKGLTDWSRLKHEYVTSPVPISYTALAKMHDLTRETVTRKGEKENWPEARIKFVDEVSAKRDEIKAVSLAEEGAEFDRTCFTLAKWMAVEAVNGRKSGEVSLGEASKVIATAQSVAKVALNGVQVPPPSGGAEGAMSIDGLLEQYGAALGLSQGTDNPTDNPAESIHPAQETQPEAVPVPVPD